MYVFIYATLHHSRKGCNCCILRAFFLLILTLCDSYWHNIVIEIVTLQSLFTIGIRSIRGRLLKFFQNFLLSVITLPFYPLVWLLKQSHQNYIVLFVLNYSKNLKITFNCMFQAVQLYLNTPLIPEIY